MMDDGPAAHLSDRFCAVHGADDPEPGALQAGADRQAACPVLDRGGALGGVCADLVLPAPLNRQKGCGVDRAMAFFVAQRDV